MKIKKSKKKKEKNTMENIKRLLFFYILIKTGEESVGRIRYVRYSKMNMYIYMRLLI